MTTQQALLEAAARQLAFAIQALGNQTHGDTNAARAALLTEGALACLRAHESMTIYAGEDRSAGPERAVVFLATDRQVRSLRAALAIRGSGSDEPTELDVDLQDILDQLPTPSQ